VPLWVKPAQDKNSGNSELVRQGARWLPEGKLDLASLGTKRASGEAETTGDLAPDSHEENGDLFSFAYSEPATKSGQVRESQDELKSGLPPEEKAVGDEEISFYSLFLRRFSTLTAKAPVAVEELLGHMDVNKSQLNDWIKRALDEGAIEKLNKPVRYRKSR
jgi:hypothetical protein